MIRCAILTVSDRSAAGEREDLSGPALVTAVGNLSANVVARRIVPDERDEIRDALLEFVEQADLILTTGGTGVGPRDVTPEATADVIERHIPGLGEEMRRRSLAVTQNAILSRAIAGTRGSTLIVNLPGSPTGAVECLGFVRKPILHAIRLLRSARSDCARERTEQ